MALVGTTLLAEATLPATTSAFNTSNLTTVSGETILVIVGFNENVGTTDPSADLTITNTGTALTYTRVLFEGTDNSFSRGMVVWTAPVTTGATIQLTFDCAARNVRRFNVFVRSYSGFDTGDFIGETGQDSDTTNAGSTYTFNLTGTTAATSETIAAVLVDGWTAVTPGASWAEISDIGSSGNLGVEVQTRSAAVSTATWAATAGNATPLVGVCVEVKAAAAGGVTGTSAQTLDAFTSTASGTVNNIPAVRYVKEVGFVTDTTGATTSTITTAGTTVPIGDYLVIYGACDNTGSGGIATTIAVADNSAQSGSANVYTLQTPQAIADPVGASAGIQGFFVVCPVTRSIPASTTITVTYGNSTAAKAINVQQFTASISGNISVLASSYAVQDNQTGQSVSVAAGANPTMAGQIVCAFAAVEGGTADAFTEDTDTTNGTWVTLTRRGSGTTTSGATLNSVYKVTTAAGAQTYNHATMLGTARDHCAAILVLNAPPISGTVAATLSPFTSTASGTVDTNVTGTSAQTLAPFTSTASGTETFTGTSAQTLAPFTSTATGTVAPPVTGTAAVTLAPFTSTATGTETITGTSAQTLAPFTSTATGTETITGTSAQTLAPFTSAAAGTVTGNVTGTSATTLAPFTSTATGTETITGTSATTLAPFTSTASGTSFTGHTGTVAATLAPFTSTASGTVTGNVTGTSATTLAPFTSTAAGTVTGATTGTAAVTLAPFTSAAAATLIITGTAAVTLGPFIGYGIEEVFVPVDGPRIRSRSPGRITSTSQARIRSRDTGLITSGV